MNIIDCKDIVIIWYIIKGVKTIDHGQIFHLLDIKNEKKKEKENQNWAKDDHIRAW